MKILNITEIISSKRHLKDIIQTIKYQELED